MGLMSLPPKSSNTVSTTGSVVTGPRAYANSRPVVEPRIRDVAFSVMTTSPRIMPRERLCPWEKLIHFVPAEFVADSTCSATWTPNEEGLGEDLASARHNQEKGH